MRIALFQPDQAGNVGTILRLGACFGVAVDINEPCGFAFSERALKRSAMDYAASAAIERHADWNSFHQKKSGRVILLTTRARATIYEMEFAPDDILLLGSERSGAPDHVHAACDEAVRIPLRTGFRSLNVAVAAGIALGEALRQTGGFG